VKTTLNTLQIELEDIAGASWWRSILASLGSQSGNAYLRFVARVGGERRYTSATFPAPRTLGELPPREEWAPGMTAVLDDLDHQIAADGWIRAGVGDQPWAHSYRRSSSV